MREVLYRGSDTDLWLEPGPLRVRTTALARFEPGEALWLELPGEHLVAMDE